jgi:hypothetical protein
VRTACRYVVAALALLFFVGCGPTRSTDVVLRHPKTGQTATCKRGSGYMGPAAPYFSQQDQIRCIDDFQRQGFERAPDPN